MTSFCITQFCNSIARLENSEPQGNSIRILQRNSKSFVKIYRCNKIEYNKVNVILSDSQLNKPQSAVKNQTGVTLRMNIKMFEGNNLPHELLFKTRQKTKLRNAFENNVHWYKFVKNWNI